MEVLIGAYDKIYTKYIEVLKGEQGKRNSMTWCRMRKLNYFFGYNCFTVCLIVYIPSAFPPLKTDVDHNFYILLLTVIDRGEY